MIKNEKIDDVGDTGSGYVTLATHNRLRAQLQTQREETKRLSNALRLLHPKTDRLPLPERLERLASECEAVVAALVYYGGLNEAAVQRGRDVTLALYFIEAGATIDETRGG